MKGRHIFMGYMYMKEKTEGTFDKDGWFLTGDMAAFDEYNRDDIPAPSGFMRIIGRIKELIVTAGGENIPPVLIEDEMKATMLALSNCMVVGDRRKYLAMVISVKTEVDPETGIPTDQLASDALFVCDQIGSSAKTVADVKSDPLWTTYFNEGMAKANDKSTSNAQRVQKWVLLDQDFSEKMGDLTPTLKLKRSVVAKKCADVIESLY